MPALLALLAASIGGFAAGDSLRKFLPLPLSLLAGFFVWVFIFTYLKRLLKGLRP